MSDTSTAPSNTYHLGLAMAGAVSAGAYTAGVLDYLFETLERWEAEKIKGGVPTHNVVLDIMGGASAGGMCAAIAPLQHLVDDKTDKEPLLKDLWINIAGKDADMFAELLKTGDIEPGEGTISMLNASCVDEIGKTIQQRLYNTFQQQKVPALPTYISGKLEILLTLFNVSGLKFKLDIKSLWRKKQQYAFEHRDLAHFKWSQIYTGDGRIPLWEDKDALHTFVQAAKATGAFPIGLSARKVKRKIKHIRDNEFISGRVGDNLVFDGGPEQLTYESLNADGGTANNEPLEYVQQVIKKLLEAEGATAQGNSGVILIDPFPAFDKSIQSQTNHEKNLNSFAGKLIGAMRSQLLFDAKGMIAEYSDPGKSNFMIAPAKADTEPDKALACGGLGGFSGFLYKDYRRHDYQLGRRNCQQFLRYYFVVMPGNTEPAAVINGYADPKTIERFGVRSGNKLYLPIIPDTFNCNVEADKKTEEAYTYTLPDKKYLWSYKGQIRRRLRYVFRNLMPLSFGWKLLAYPLIEIAVLLLPGFILKKIYTDLKEIGVIR
ncbi:MAG: patatin-like phospholipase family protein [Chitinophagales bacterium]|nr:patatin-like phospholipase family protein [Chitinophagales bacterium]